MMLLFEYLFSQIQSQFYADIFNSWQIMYCMHCFFSEIHHLGVIIQVLADMNMECKWRELGQVLQVNDLETIQQEHGRNPKRCFISMLINWLRGQYNQQQQPKPPCWKTLAEAVKNPVGGRNKRQADRIRLNCQSMFNDYNTMIVLLVINNVTEFHTEFEVKGG